jgi:CRISPR-associated protein Cas2
MSFLRGLKMGRSRTLIIGYDISDNKARNRVFQILKQWRMDGQKSVHVCRMTRTKADELFLKIGCLIDPKTDSLLFAWVIPNRRVLAKGLGQNRITGKLWHIN